MQYKQPLRWFFSWLAVGCALLVLVLYLSLTSAPIMIPDVQFGDKVGHYLAYFALVFWFSQLYTRRCYIWVLASFITMGITVEFIQGQTDYRTFQIADIAANMLGALWAWLLVRSQFGDILLRLERTVLKAPS